MCPPTITLRIDIEVAVGQFGRPIFIVQRQYTVSCNCARDPSTATKTIRFVLALEHLYRNQAIEWTPRQWPDDGPHIFCCSRSPSRPTDFIRLLVRVPLHPCPARLLNPQDCAFAFYQLPDRDQDTQAIHACRDVDLQHCNVVLERDLPGLQVRAYGAASCTERELRAEEPLVLHLGRVARSEGRLDPAVGGSVQYHGFEIDQLQP